MQTNYLYSCGICGRWAATGLPVGGARTSPLPVLKSLAHSADHERGACADRGRPSAAARSGFRPSQGDHVDGIEPHGVLLLRSGQQHQSALRHGRSVMRTQRACGGGIDVLHRLQALREMRFAREPTPHGRDLGRRQLTIVAGREDLVVELLLRVHGWAVYRSGACSP